MTVHHAITWAHMTALEHGGHDKFLPSLANDELRFTMASIREHFAAQVGDVARRGESDLREAREVATRNAAERSHKTLSDWFDAFRGRVTVALASQPEAPGCCPFMRSGGFHGEDCADQGRAPCGQPEAPKGQAGHGVSLLELTEGKLAAANAKIAELEAELNRRIMTCDGCDAANARADAAEAQLRALRVQFVERHSAEAYMAQRDRADAAELKGK